MGFIIELLIVVVIFALLWKALKYVFGFFVLVAWLPGIIGLGAGVVIPFIVTSLMFLSLPFFSAYWSSGDALDLYNWESGKYFILYPIVVYSFYCRNAISSASDKISDDEFYLEKKKSIGGGMFASLVLLVCSVFNFDMISLVLEWLDYMGWLNYMEWKQDWFVYLYFVPAIFIPIGVLAEGMGFAELVNRSSRCVEVDKCDSLARVKKEIFLDDKFGQFELDVVDSVIAKKVLDGKLIEDQLGSERVLFDPVFLQSIQNKLSEATAERIKWSKVDVVKGVAKILEVDINKADDFVRKFMGFGGVFRLDGEQAFINGMYSGQYRVCASCGHTELTPLTSDVWYCSDYCRETEENCEKIMEQSPKVFLDNAATTGLLLVEGAGAWKENHKMFSIGGQGHGFAAEEANDLLDTLSGKNARIVGGDNAKNGPDRLVDGMEIQTKYYGTAARSVGAAFDGQTGSYKYIASDGKPMPVEVPADQYEKALDTMQKKISAGKVSGITDPDEAKSLVVKGSVTYAQAQNITRFGTIESLAYDSAEGAIVGLKSGGISFSINIAVAVFHGKSTKEAIRYSAMRAASSFGKSTLVYIGVQQLHRLASVQNALTVFDITKASPAVKNTLMRATGTSNASQASHVIKGTVVTSAVMIAVSSGPDIIRMVRGRMSSRQFLKNLSVATTSTVGGTVGSFAVGAVCSPLGPAGVIAGRVAGGFVGGYLGSRLGVLIGNKLGPDDQEVMFDIIREQMEHISINLMFSDKEVENFYSNLVNVADAEMLEKMYAAEGQRYQFANAFLKPIAVGIAKQRPAVVYDQDDLQSSLESLA